MRLQGLTSRKTTKVERIRNLAKALSIEADSFAYESKVADVFSNIRHLSLESRVDFFEEVRQFEITLISRALELAHGNQTQAAVLLGLKITTLHSKMKVYQIR